jgi:hypothetical protein
MNFFNEILDAIVFCVSKFFSSLMEVTPILSEGGAVNDSLMTGSINWVKTNRLLLL